MMYYAALWILLDVVHSCYEWFNAIDYSEITNPISRNRLFLKYNKIYDLLIHLHQKYKEKKKGVFTDQLTCIL